VTKPTPSPTTRAGIDAGKKEREVNIPLEDRVYRASTAKSKKEILMSTSSQVPPRDPVQTAYRDGRRIGLATGALALSVVSFVNMFGFEKSVLAIVLAILAMQGTEPLGIAIRRGRTALVLASAHVITIVVVLVMFRDKLVELLNLLHKLS
jgi:hypothetical protein